MTLQAMLEDKASPVGVEMTMWTLTINPKSEYTCMSANRVRT